MVVSFDKTHHFLRFTDVFFLFTDRCQCSHPSTPAHVLVHRITRIFLGRFTLLRKTGTRIRFIFSFFLRFFFHLMLRSWFSTLKNYAYLACWGCEIAVQSSFSELFDHHAITQCNHRRAQYCTIYLPKCLHIWLCLRTGFRLWYCGLVRFCTIS